MLLKTVLATLCLICGIVAAPEGKTVLGYRTVNDVEATKINNAGAPVWEDDKNYGGGRQLGAGIYVGTFPGAWKQTKEKSVCVIYIDTDKLNALPKVWIPRNKPNTNNKDDEVMWYDDKGTEIPRYIDSLKLGWASDRCLLMSWVQDIKDLLQLLIPPQLVVDGEDIGLTAVCKKDDKELPDRAVVEYDTWQQDNVGGDRGPQVDWNGDPL